MIELILSLLLGRRLRGQSAAMIWIMICLALAACIVVVVIMLQGGFGKWDPTAFYRVPGTT